jgi:hypothetical protein
MAAVMVEAVVAEEDLSLVVAEGWVTVADWCRAAAGLEARDQAAAAGG